MHGNVNGKNDVATTEKDIYGSFNIYTNNTGDILLKSIPQDIFEKAQFLFILPMLNQVNSRLQIDKEMNQH